MGWSLAVAWDQLGCSVGRGGGVGWGGRHPTQSQPLYFDQAGRLAAGMPRPGGEEFFIGGPAREMPCGER